MIDHAALGIQWAPVIIFFAVVAPIWIIAHYVTRWRTSQVLSGADGQMLEDLWRTAERMEDRLKSLEQILDSNEPADPGPRR